MAKLPMHKKRVTNPLHATKEITAHLIKVYDFKDRTTMIGLGLALTGIIVSLIRRTNDASMRADVIAKLIRVQTWELEKKGDAS